MRHLYGIHTYSIYDDLTLDRIGASEAVGHKTMPASLEEMAASSNRNFVKTHDFPSDDRPAVYLVRDGRDALVSYAKYTLKYGGNRTRRAFNSIRERLGIRVMPAYLKSLIKQDCQFGGWSRNVLEWTVRREAPTCLVRYEDLVEQPAEQIQIAMDKLGLPLADPPSGSLPSFAELHEKWPDFFRKGNVGDWRMEMPTDLHELFWQHHGEAMSAVGYQR